MPRLDKSFTGARGLVYYGNTLLFVNDWKVNISMDLLDITNVGIYITAGFPTGLPPKVNNLDFPEGRKLDELKDFPLKQAQYGASRVFTESNLRTAKISCSGLCARPFNITGNINEYYMPRIGNHVTMQFSNSLNAETTLFTFPDCIVSDVTFELDVRNYERWTMEATATQKYGEKQWETDWDIYPGDGKPFNP
jgi:hypothetical protein